MSNHDLKQRGRAAKDDYFDGYDIAQTADELVDALEDAEAESFRLKSELAAATEHSGFLAQYLAEMGEPIRIGRGTHLGGARIAICRTDSPSGFTAELVDGSGERVNREGGRVSAPYRFVNSRAGVLGDFPAAGATMQFKGTDICLDIQCECGESSHFDGYFAYAIECGACGKQYDLSRRVAIEPFTGQYAAVVTFTEGEPTK